MSEVVLRCPNCGTTKASPGECDACHEADVRFFCTNHQPGRWLESDVCPDCGARFGESISRPSSEVATVRTDPVVSPQAIRSRRSMEPVYKTLTRGRATLDTISGEDLPGEAVEKLRRQRALREVIMARLPELLRTRRDTPMEDPETVYLRPAAPRLGGVLFRALFLGFFLLMALFFFALLLGGSLLGGFGVVFI
ncbi:MAG TPA: hypothetical protein VGB81_07355 [Devosia sp.]